MGISKEWLDAATIKELEIEDNELSQEIDSIGHQMDLALLDKKTLDKTWLAKAKYARQCKITDRDWVRRELTNRKKESNIKKSRCRDSELIKFIRKEIGLARFYEIVEKFNNLESQS